MLEISFDSCGWLSFFHFGVARYFKQRFAIDNVSDDGVKYSGASGGAICATFMCLDICSHRLSDLMILSLKEFNGPWEIAPKLKDTLETIIDDDAHERCNGRLGIAVTNLDGTPNMIKHFSSKEKLISALCASCHIPGICGVLPYDLEHHGSVYDGGLFNRAPQLNEDGNKVIFVSATSLNPLADIRLPFSPAMSWTLFPPSAYTMRLMERAGYLTARKYSGENEGDLNDVIHHLKQKATVRKLLEISIPTIAVLTLVMFFKSRR